MEETSYSEDPNLLKLLLIIDTAKGKLITRLFSFSMIRT